MKYLIGIAIAILGLAVTVKAATALSNSQLANAGRSEVYRVVDNDAGVVCYVVPQAHCTGDCAYSPAISCLKL